MMFYDECYLKSNKDTSNDFAGVVTLPDIEVVKKGLRSYINSSFFAGHPEMKVVFIKRLYNDGQRYQVGFGLEYMEGTLKRSLNLVTMNINTTDYNCSSILFANLNSTYPGNGFAGMLVSEILEWAKGANYSYIYCNFAEMQKKSIMPLLKKYGAEKFAHYHNPRSGNNNLWYHLILNQKGEKK